ncbi:MAG: hypothetical protein H6625_11910 [Bdellovibrionaceae bacterium]|nr:hypothetical protein [Pseudobdellovibrionaceae bacterium]
MVILFSLLLGWQLHAEAFKNTIGAQWLQKQYITQKESPEHSQDYSEVALSWKFKKDGTHWNRGLDTQVFYSVGRSNEFYAHLREAYVTYNINDNHSLDMGRVKKPWSFVDEIWSVGLWEPALKNDGFNFSREGLAGFFYNLKSSPWFLTLYASPLFLPDQGPLVKVEKGQLISANRWFNNRVNSVRIGEIESPIVYNLHKPAIEDVLLQNSLAFDFGWGDREKGWRFHSAFADKAINQLFVGVRPIHNVSLKNVKRESELHLYPQVHRHRLLTAEVSYFADKRGGWLSVNTDQPYEQNMDTTWITPAFVKEHIFSAGVDGEWKKNKVSLSYFQRESEQAEPTSIFSAEDLSRLSDRYDFRKATLVNFQRKDSLGSYGQVKINLRWVHSLASDADMLSAQWEYNYFKDWSWLLGGDLIGTKNEDNNDFFARNRSNDRIYGGMTYVF